MRVRSPEQEEQAQLVLKEHGARALRVHEIEIEKRLQGLPLSSVNPDPLLEGERVGKV